MEFNDGAALPSGPDDTRMRAELTKADMFGSGGGMSADTMKSVSDSAQGLIAAAKSGGFKMTADGVKPMRDAIRDCLEELEYRIYDADTFSQPPPIGAGPYQKQIAPHYAAGGQTAKDSLIKFRELLRDCDEALSRAAGIYQDTDAASEDTFRNDGGSGEYSGSFQPSSGSGGSYGGSFTKGA